MKPTLLFIALYLFSLPLFSQDFDVPEDITLNSEADYAKYDADVIKAYQWLMETPINEQPEKRKEVSAFFILWLTGAPSVSVEVNADILTFMKTEGCLFIFMGGWTKYVLETQDKDKVKGNLAGVESVIEFYKKNKAVLGKDKAIEKYIKLQEKGKLEEHIAKKIGG